MPEPTKPRGDSKCRSAIDPFRVRTGAGKYGKSAASSRFMTKAPIGWHWQGFCLTSGEGWVTYCHARNPLASENACQCHPGREMTPDPFLPARVRAWAFHGRLVTIPL